MNSHRPLALTIGFYGLALLLALLAIGPAVWLFAIALSPASLSLSQVPTFSQLTLDNFRGAWSEAQLLRPILNSIFVTATLAACNVLLASLAAYPLACMNFRGRNLIFMLMLVTIMVPEQVILVPLFRTIVGMGLYDTLLAVILPFSVTAFGVYLCRQSFASIPLELEEAARIDGAHALQIWWHVMLPLAKPTLATLAVFSVIGAWSNLLWPLVVLQEQRNYTLPVALNQLLGVFATNVRYAYAGSALALLPMVAFFLLMQRWMQRGLLAGAVKG